MKKLLLISLAALGLAALGLVPVALANGAGGVTPPAIYVNGELYRTVGTPALLPDSAPESSFQPIYDVSQCQGNNIATAAPGDPGFRGGRWAVHKIQFDWCPSPLVSYAELKAQLDSGNATDLGIVKRFECPLIHVPKKDQ